ncbi:MerR family DNA-binding protein [Sutcliffiella sp. NC1]|uniref:MerR family DNA-binding protein n=1 Tax=Sutcliffiella sp. NC1 TaxID=3004096 RepID=UPI0022DD2CE0|nr:MerR family DNA-binding protein [Sutcliffiella sp. NC1]WBL15744.1 MerR family DNA-binding protein [Sutcliffiella sp. NC1]
MTEQKFFSIQELASLFDISSRTIRYYEEIGMLVSKERDSATKQRQYSNQQRRRLKLILRGKKLGFSLQEIKDMVDLYEHNPKGADEKNRILAYADKKLIELEEQILELQVLKDEIEAHKQSYLLETNEKEMK